MSTESYRNNQELFIRIADGWVLFCVRVSESERKTLLDSRFYWNAYIIGWFATASPFPISYSR